MTNLSPVPKRDTLRIAVLTLAATLVGLAAITNQSLWMDEGSGAFKALIPNLKDWWALTLRIGGSDVQMPVYMFLLWCWAQLGALNEYALRAINLPWLIIAVLALRKVHFWPLVCLTCPFVLYYTGEIRPYAMQIAAGSLAAAALSKIIANRERSDFYGLHAAGAAALLLVCSSLTAVIWAGGLWLGVLIIRPDWLGRRIFWVKAFPWIAGGLVFAAYYTFTLFKGYRATGISGSSVLSIFFGAYEIMGLLGVGPSKNELRLSPMAITNHLATLVPAFMFIAGAWTYGFRTWIKTVPIRCVVAIACAVLCPILILTVIGMLQNFQVLGRHFSPAIPAMLLPLAVTLSSGTKARVPLALGVPAVVFMIASSISLRYSENHARDDYRKATLLGIKALEDGKSVWWQADMNATRYYAYRSGGMSLINAIQVLESNPPTGMMFADVIIVNRPDLRYRQMDYQKEMEKNFFKLDSKFTGFEIWKNR